MNEPNSDTNRPEPPDTDDERWAAAHRRSNFLSAISILLVVLIVGMVWYAYPTLQASDASLHNLPSLTERFNQTVDSMGDRVKAAETKVGDSIKAQQSLRAQVKDLGQNLRARIDTVSKEASQSVEDSYHRIETKFDGQMKTQSDGLTTVTDRVSRLESSHDADQVQVAQLQQQVDQMRDQQSEAQAQVRQLDESRSSQSDQIAALKHDVDGISGQLAVQKITFEASKDQSSDLADGITLHVESTNPAVRQVSGWVWVGSDRRSIWLKDQSAQEPVIFYGNRDGQKRELVFTNVAPNSVTGYLLLPKQAGTAALRGTSDGNAEASAH